MGAQHILRAGRHYTAPGASSFLSDAFPDADGTAITSRAAAIGGTPVGNAAALYSSSMVVAANRARGQDDYFCAVYADAAPATPEYTVFGDLYVASLDDIYTLQVCARALTGADTMYLGGYSTFGTPAWVFYLANGGSYTSLGSYAQTLTAGQTYQWKIQCLDATKKLFVKSPGDPDYIERISSTDNTLTAAGHPGIRGGVAGALTGLHLDNLSAVNA